MLDYPALMAVAAVIREGSFERAAAALRRRGRLSRETRRRLNA